jgi:serine/threonine-protein kinase
MKTCPQCKQRYPEESTFCFLDGGTLVAETDPRIGMTIAGRYVLEAVVGEGGMSTVYRARHRVVDRPCAVKILNAPFSADATVRERFRREARHAQRLAHPNIIEIFDQGDTEDGTAFLVMELLEGKTLAELIDVARVPIPRLLPILIQVARALSRAHDFEVIHRDLKPENIFLLEGDRVKLIDLGIARCLEDARLTNQGEVFGTPQYMAPERGLSIDAGPSVDLYALGVIAFEAITQKLPFNAKDAASLLVKHMREPAPHLRPVAPEVPEALDQLVFALMAKKPEERPVDAHRVLKELSALAWSLSIPVPPEPEIPSPPPAPQRTGGIERWKRRGELFEQMLARAFGAAAPPDLRRSLDLMQRHVSELDELRARSIEEERRLEVVEQEARSGRIRFGRAMDALSVDVSQTREEARALRLAVGPLAEAAKNFPERLLAVHREVVTWEGRCGFAEPHADLVVAYRRAADVVEEWHTARRVELESEARALEKERAVADVDFQIRELRTGLESLDQSVEDKRAASHKAMAEMGQRADQLEAELLHLAGRFCAPLRAKPELLPIFQQLEQDGARPA